MDKRLNELLIQEINKSIESLNHDKAQLTEELQKYQGRDEASGKAEFENDLSKINRELNERKSDLEKAENINKSKAAIDNEEKDFEKDYQKLLKEKDEYEAAIKELEGKKVFENGVLVNTKEQQEYEQDLSKINMSLKKFEDLKEQHKKELEEPSATIEGLLEKYHIREKYKKELGNEPLNVSQQPIGEPKKKEKTKVIYSNSQPTKMPSKDMNQPKNIENITCSIIEGKLVYTIVGLNEKGEQFTIAKEAKPRKISPREKRDILKSVDKYGLKNVDLQLYRILKNDKDFRNTELAYDYLNQVDRLTEIDDKDNGDMNIIYNLQNIRSANLNIKQKRQIKALAKRNEKNNIAEYIKPTSKISKLFGRFKQKLLTAGTEKKQEKVEELSREDMIYSTYKDLSQEEGFDFNQFCKDMSLSDAERKELESYEKVNASTKSFYKSLKNPVTFTQTNSHADKDANQKESEHSER